LAKYWTAELAVQTAKWAMEVHGGLGTLEEYHVERWLREAMILAIWEGTSHRQILDGLEVMERRRAHRLLFQHLAATALLQACEKWNHVSNDNSAYPRKREKPPSRGSFPT
jgi:hypothetical protein